MKLFKSWTKKFFFQKGGSNSSYYKSDLQRLLPFDAKDLSFVWKLKNVTKVTRKPVINESFNVLNIDVPGEKDVVVEANKVGQPFHIVNPSPYPFFLSIFFLFLLGSTICSMRSDFGTFGFHWFWIVGLASVLFGWFQEISYEEFLGNHTLEVQQGFRYGIILFILSELMLFVSFFWAYFHISLTHNIFTGSTFPPVGVVIMPWDSIPWVNTLVLLTSGITLTLAHSILITNDRRLKSAFWAQYFYSYLDRKDVVKSFGVTIRPSAYETIGALSKGVAAYFKLKFFAETRFRASLPNRATPGVTGSAFYNLENSTLFYLFDTIDGTLKTKLLSKTNVFFSVAVNEFVAIKAFCFNDHALDLSRQQYKYKVFKRVGFYSTFVWLADVVIRGVVFLGLQAIEYVKSLFTIKTSAFGGCFFALTGLHCVHVIFGLVMLITCLILSTKSHLVVAEPRGVGKTVIGGSFVWGHRVGFDGAAWYWHFVDVVWFVLFTVVYWWPLQESTVDYSMFVYTPIV